MNLITLCVKVNNSRVIIKVNKQQYSYSVICKISKRVCDKPSFCITMVEIFENTEEQIKSLTKFAREVKIKDTILRPLNNEEGYASDVNQE